jgi:tetratricopeptide (TPR) repeat protein
LAAGLYERALVHLSQGQLPEARSALEQVLLQEPRHGKAAANLGKLLLDGGEARAAGRMVGLALAEEGGLQQVIDLVQRCVLTLASARDPSQRDGAQALALADQLLAQRGPADGLPEALRAAALAEQGDFAAAIAAAERALSQARAASNRRAAAAVSEQLAGYRQGQPLRMPPSSSPRSN